MSAVLHDIQDWSLAQAYAVGPQLRAILRSRIIRNDLAAGVRISEPALARQYGTSRQPVREALITLAAEGLVEIRPQRGTFVKRIDPEGVLSAQVLREAAEADIVRRVATAPPEGLDADLEAQIDAQRRALRDAPSRFMELDEHFHRTIAAAAGLGRVWDVLDGIKAQMDRVRFLTDGTDHLATLLEQHAAVAEGIAARDPDAAERAMRTHLRAILESLPGLRQQFPDYFDGADDVPKVT